MRAVETRLAYRELNHERLPHVVRFSGGRSSALMALRLACDGVLRRGRGDVVLFANTTAEHPGTYEFARRVCEEIENRTGVPCLWCEGCAVEAATRSGYTRLRTFRLVRREPAADDDDPRLPGYRSRGEAFEEMVSWARLPSRWRRMCTTELKVRPGHDLVAEWMHTKRGPALGGTSATSPGCRRAPSPTHPTSRSMRESTPRASNRTPQGCPTPHLRRSIKRPGTCYVASADCRTFADSPESRLTRPSRGPIGDTVSQQTQPPTPRPAQTSPPKSVTGYCTAARGATSWSVRNAPTALCCRHTLLRPSVL